MNWTIIHKLVIVYFSTAIFICSLLVWSDPLINMLSVGFLLGFVWNETFFAGKRNDD
jgi:hypothetical protein